jgi:hypothetical protein
VQHLERLEEEQQVPLQRQQRKSVLRRKARQMKTQEIEVSRFLPQTDVEYGL